MNNDATLEEFQSALASAIERFGLDPLTKEQTVRLVRHYSMLVRWNRRVNLTRIIAPGEAARLHYAESLYGGCFIAGARSILDVGSGAGFPAVPLAILLSDCRVTALEASQKKSLFLSEVKDALSLENLTIARRRFEEFDWSGFDLITSRALERAEDVWTANAARLGRRQRLMLYSTPDLVSRLSETLSDEFQIETHPIPLAENRTISLVSVKTANNGDQNKSY